MHDTTKALADLRAHWHAEGCPPISKIAKKANVTSATANRYLSGITKIGAPETIRALAIAMDRRDIADSLQFKSTGLLSRNPFIPFVSLPAQPLWHRH